MEYSEKPHFSIVLPAYNESKNLTDVLRGLKLALEKAGIPSEIIVIDNASTDNTREVLERLKREISGLKTLRIERNVGLGNGVVKGLEAAQGDVLGFMVADGQVESQSIVDAFQKLKKENLDFCKGFRINRCDGWKRIAMSKIYNFLFRIMFDYRLKDAGGGPKIFTRHFYETVKPQTKGYFIDNEMLIKAKHYNFAIGEMQVVSLKRRGGRSSVSILTSLEFLKEMFYWFLFKKL